MSTRVILILVFLAALLLLALIILLERRKKREPEERGYIKALYSLIEGNRQNALLFLKEGVKTGERRVGAYILLGDLLRDEGQPDKALQIHRSMSVRRDLTEENKRDIQLAISRDLMALNRFQEAISTLENIRKWKNYPGIVFALHRFYHRNGEYEKAHKALSKFVKLESFYSNDLVKAYLTSVASEFLQRGNWEKGAEYSEKAISMDRNYTPALYTCGLSYYRDGDNNKAIEKWITLLRNDISYLSLTLKYLEKMLFEQQDFGRLETILTDLYDRNKGNPEVFRAIASFYERKGEIDKVIDYFESEINQLVLDDKLIIRMAGIYLDKGNTTKASETLERYTAWAPPARMFKCENCSAVMEFDLPYCLKCGGINTFLEYYEDISV